MQWYDWITDDEGTIPPEHGIAMQLSVFDGWFSDSHEFHGVSPFYVLIRAFVLSAPKCEGSCRWIEYFCCEGISGWLPIAVSQDKF